MPYQSGHLLKYILLKESLRVKVFQHKNCLIDRVTLHYPHYHYPGEIDEMGG